MRNAGGYASLSYPEGAVKECDTFSCAHCNAIRHVKARQDPTELGGLCKGCMKLICGKCVNEGVCSPFLKKLDEWEARNHALRSYGLSSPF